MKVCYPQLDFDLARDSFVIWLRWVTMPISEKSRDSSASLRDHQGIRVELQINCNPVFGPTILERDQLAPPLYMRANAERSRQILSSAESRGVVDLQLIIHGSIANAPYAALYHVRDYQGGAIETEEIEATPLLQIQPSVPGDQWQVAGQANLRVRIKLIGSKRRLLVVN